MGAGAQKTQAKAAAAVGEYNAQLEELETVQSDADAQENIRRQRLLGRQFQGEQRAAMAGSGVVMGTGSPLELEGITAGILELQVQDAARKADLGRRAGFARARMARWAGENQATGYKMASYGTILGSAANAVGSYVSARG
jgi:hypothetical protein